MTEKKYQDLLEKRHSLENDIQNLEKQIYDLETRYLEETANTGNILKGWDAYLQNKNNQKGQQQRKQKININDRLFSMSSLTSPVQQQTDETTNERINGVNQVAHPFRPKRTKKNKNYARMGESKQQQEELNEIESSDSSEDYQGGIKKKIKGIKKY